MSDSFFRSDENPLSDGGAWTSPYPGDQPLQLVGGAAEGTDAGVGISDGAFTGQSWATLPDQWAAISLKVINSNCSLFAYLRSDPTNEAPNFGSRGSGYGCQLLNGYAYIQTRDSFPDIAPFSFSTDDQLIFQVRGSTLSVFLNDIRNPAKLTAVDITWASGVVGMGAYGATVDSDAQIGSFLSR